MIDTKLITLLKVYETGSFSRAAEQLSLTQPAVSQHVRQLENDLGVKFFIRREGNMKLPAEGEVVVRYARRMMSLYQNLKQTLQDEKNNKTRVSVGVTHTSESNLMTEVLAKYCNTRSGMRLTIFTDTTANLYNMLRT